MSSGADFDEHASKRINAAPYSGRRPVPTVQGYHALEHEREAEHERSVTPTPSTDSNASSRSTKSKRRSILSSAKDLFRTVGARSVSKGGEPKGLEPHQAQNRNVDGSTARQQESFAEHDKALKDQPVHAHDHVPLVGKREPEREVISDEDRTESKDDAERTEQGSQREQSRPSNNGNKRHANQEDQPSNEPLKDMSEAIDGALNPGEKRKQMEQKGRDLDRIERDVTDPVTHLPTTIHDSTEQELDRVPENIPPPGTELRSATGLRAKSKSSSQIEKETDTQQLAHNGMQKLFPPPDFDKAKREIGTVYGLTLSIGILSAYLGPLLLLIAAQVVSQSREDGRKWLNVRIVSFIMLVAGVSSGGLILYGLRAWLEKRISSVWEDHLWDAARRQELESSDSKTPESVQWLNSLLTSIWGLINPDLFTSLMDTVEDVMQASLPKLVKMVSVEDLGQGSESIRILGIRCLPSGASAMSVSNNGKAKPSKDRDRQVPGQGELAQGESSSGESEGNDRKDPKETEDEENVAEGMEAEEGDFVNMEVAFSYRASTSGRKLADKTKNAHLFLGFYLPGGMKFPVWVELKGIVGTMRLRLQLTPEPPFFSLCTLTFLGQPKVDLSCVPLTKRGLNIMDLPVISSFVQSSIDAALAEYVAPKSMILNLKSMLVGDDFKKDTVGRGILMVKIKRGRDFKEGDSSALGLGDGSSDPYVAVGWAKFGKPIWSTRVIMAEMEPVWEEIAFILVTPEEINAQERLRVQLWDSDRGSADDDLGRVEVDLKELMTSPNSSGKMWDRTDGLQSFHAKEKMPGTLDWAVGYFAKTRIQQEQIQNQQVEPEIRSLSQLKEKVSKDADRKLREATDRNDSRESEQQKAQDLKEKEDAMIISTPPVHIYPSGIFAIQIHQINGIEYEQPRKNQDTGDDNEEGEGDLPSAYCTIILNHQKIFKTRTKPKNPKPFYNAGTERFIRDWRSTEVMISVRDSRVHENDALLGMIYLPLGELLRHRAQIVGNYPLVGGIGHARARISMLFRSVQLQLPENLLGWDYGTLEIVKPVTASDASAEIDGLRMKFRTSVNRAKLYASQSANGKKQWTAKHDTAHLAVRKRYCSCLTVEFRKNNIGIDKTVGFGVLWLKDLPDDEEVVTYIKVWRADKEAMKRGTSNVVQDLGEKLGTLQVPLIFRRGLGAYHEKLASKSPNLQDVFEVLKTANENKEVKLMSKSDDSSDSSSDSDSSDSSGDDNVNDGKGGLVSDIKHYKKHSDQLHRRQRGIMQWKGARTMDYLKTKADHGKDHFLDRFKHHEREPGIEMEV